MEQQKRIYSLNLAAFVMARTGYEPVIKLDENTNTYYCVYPSDNPSVAGAVYDFRRENTVVVIQDFLKAIKHIRTAMHGEQQTKNGAEDSNKPSPAQTND